MTELEALVIEKAKKYTISRTKKNKDHLFQAVHALNREQSDSVDRILLENNRTYEKWKYLIR